MREYPLNSIQRLSKNASLQTRSQDHAGVHEVSVHIFCKYAKVYRVTSHNYDLWHEDSRAGQGLLPGPYTGVFGKSIYCERMQRYADSPPTTR